MMSATLAIASPQAAYEVLVMDDGSTDGAVQGLRDLPIHVLANETNCGIGAAMKRVFAHSLQAGYDILVIMAGNNKDDPTEIPRLVDPIVRGEADFVQGSRFLAGGGHGNMPVYRQLATRFHPVLFSLAVGKYVTESTNGFRAFRTSILADKRIDWRQDWLDKYELEPYLLYKAIKLGYRHAEAPVTKVYPPRKLGYTKMKPIIGWWSILRPIFLLAFGLRK
jgi:dolichol-phosphate mannosyltransferase